MTEEEIISICKKEVADAIVKYSLINACQEDIDDLICYSFEDSLKFYKSKNIINEKIIRIIVKRLLGIRNLEKNFQMELSSEERYSKIIDEAYNNFVSLVEKYREEDYTRPVISKDEFVSESKLHRDFSDVWGLKIEERELSLEERMELADKINTEIRQDLYSYAFNNPIYTGGVNQRPDDVERHELLSELKIPTKLITVTYNNETIEVYE